ncbi:MAG: flavodoxin domain-containing protein [Bacteroidales bacterium]|jgi:menaquinone-dependent protoporphyrinogen IX oxidase|nr:flavodoxin domain-containing protein [Bacteroidales bacterium]
MKEAKKSNGENSMEKSTILIVYHSKYGYTKQYVQWLAEELKADVCDTAKLKPDTLKHYSTIVFGSGLYHGTNKAAKSLVKNFNYLTSQKVVLFTCGLADVSKESNIIGIYKTLDKIIPVDIKNKIKIFHIRGGIDYGKLTVIDRILMKMLWKLTRKKSEEQLTDEDKEFFDTYGQKVNFSDKQMLNSIIDYCL